MKAEFYKVRGTEMEEMMKRGNNNEISSMVSQKRQALAEALENVEFYKSIGNMEFAANEENRAKLLFGRDYMWVRERENCKPLLLVEF